MRLIRYRGETFIRADARDVDEAHVLQVYEEMCTKFKPGKPVWVMGVFPHKEEKMTPQGKIYTLTLELWPKEGVSLTPTFRKRVLTSCQPLYEKWGKQAVTKWVRWNIHQKVEFLFVFPCRVLF